ncbi:MAG: hypothetical protein PHN44_00210 [Candidatus Marinimicrobia bacterium]|nr:hypothetical protein [Candidatus Neomarinimicrobiota bacterium]
MEITKIKYWTKIVQQESVDHVKIEYSDNGRDVTVHEYGNNSQAAPEFYKAMNDFSASVAAACNLPDELIEKISVREINIKIGEDKEGEDNTHYSIIASLKSGTTVTEIRATVQHKYIPEGFEDSILEIVAQAERYIKGERAQVALDLPTTPESSDVENEEDEQNE